MNHRERVVVYTALIALAALNLASLFGAGRSIAVATQTPPLEKLGPAESLTLVDADHPTDNVALRNRAGHVAWGDQPYHAAYSTAFIHVGKPMFGLLRSEPYQEQLNELRDELTAEGKDRDNELRGLYEQLQGMDQNSPEFGDLQRRFQQLSQQFQQWQVNAQQRMGQLEAELLLRAYDEVVAAVEVVAERQNIDIVLRFLPLELDDDTEITSPEQAQSVIRGRTALKYPEALDITNAVMEELALDVE